MGPPCPRRPRAVLKPVRRAMAAAALKRCLLAPPASSARSSNGTLRPRTSAACNSQLASTRSCSRSASDWAISGLRRWWHASHEVHHQSLRAPRPDQSVMKPEVRYVEEKLDDVRLGDSTVWGTTPVTNPVDPGRGALWATMDRGCRRPALF